MYLASPDIYVGTLEEYFPKTVDASVVRDWGGDELYAIRKFTRLMSLMESYLAFGPIMVACEQGKSRSPTLVRMYCESRGLPYQLMDYQPSDYMQRVYLRWRVAL